MQYMDREGAEQGFHSILKSLISMWNRGSSLPQKDLGFHASILGGCGVLGEAGTHRYQPADTGNLAAVSRGFSSEGQLQRCTLGHQAP